MILGVWRHGLSNEWRPSPTVINSALDKSSTRKQCFTLQGANNNAQYWMNAWSLNLSQIILLPVLTPLVVESTVIFLFFFHCHLCDGSMQLLELGMKSTTVAVSTNLNKKYKYIYLEFYWWLLLNLPLRMVFLLTTQRLKSYWHGEWKKYHPRDQGYIN